MYGIAFISSCKRVLHTHTCRHGITMKCLLARVVWSLVVLSSWSLCADANSRHACRSLCGELLPECLSTYSSRAAIFIGWSNNHFNNLHFISSLETKEKYTHAAETSHWGVVIVWNVGCWNGSKTRTWNLDAGRRARARNLRRVVRRTLGHAGRMLLGEKGIHWHFGECKSRLTGVPKRSLCQKTWNLQWPH